jgi:signal transduction histidine kinase
MDQSERLLHLLLHELRTPLGTACGYARLLREDRLPLPQDRDQALAAMQKALGGITQLCDDAGAFLNPPTRLPGRPAEVRTLVDRLAAVLGGHGIATSAGELNGLGTVGVGGTLDALGNAIATLAGRVAREVGRVVVDADCDASRLRFVVRPEAADALAFETPFDPWHGAYKIDVLLACRAIDAAGGRVWSSSPATPALAVTFPMEGGPS